jgi:hypothetical protein
VNVLSANRLKGAADDGFARRTRHTGYPETMLLVAIHEVFPSPRLLVMVVQTPNKSRYPTGREFFNPGSPECRLISHLIAAALKNRIRWDRIDSVVSYGCGKPESSRITA